MKKKLLIGLAVVLAFVIIILSLPTQPEPEITPNPLNTGLYLALASVGIEDAVVDITPERALIRYNLPANMSKESANYYIMGAAATIANSSKIVIQVYENFMPVEEVVVSTEDVLAFINGTISYKELEKRIETKSLK